MSESNISVVISAYTEDRWDDLVSAVRSVQQQTLPAHDVIVVVDHNTALLQRATVGLPNVTVVENHEPRGLSGARNSGTLVARGAVVAFLDDDAVADTRWLTTLVQHYEDSHVLGVGGAIEPDWVGTRPAWFPEEFAWVVGCTYRGMPLSTTPVRNLIGCNMSFRREMLLAIGGFRSGIGRIGTLPVGCDETELCIRALQRWPDGIMLYEPAATVRHRVPDQRTRWSYFRSRCFAEGISKAMVARIVGSEAGLASERSYTLRTLPRGILRGVMDTGRAGNLSGLTRAGAIAAGFSVTTAGYLAGRIRLSTGNQPIADPPPAPFGGRAHTLIGRDSEKGSLTT